jgi:hypothetical protein
VADASATEPSDAFLFHSAPALLSPRGDLVLRECLVQLYIIGFLATLRVNGRMCPRVATS